MAKTRVLIAVKTYPTLSGKYDELVCTAGFLEDGTWIRIYPIPYRKLAFDQRYKKWQWIEIDLTKNTSDFRKESYRPIDIDQDIILREYINTNNNWAARKAIALKNVKFNMSNLIAEAKNPQIGTSLAILKPSAILDFVWEPCDREWDAEKLKSVIAHQQMGSLFEAQATAKVFKVVHKVPYEFSYVFKTEDGKVRKLMIEDWELGMLYWNCLKKTKGNEQEACELVKKKYWNEFVQKCDLYFILGTTKRFHNVGPNPFIIIGLFHPRKDNKESHPSLFD